MATVTLPPISATDRFVEAITTAWEFFKTAGQPREAFDSLASSVRGIIPVVVSERRALEALLSAGCPTHVFRALPHPPDRVAIRDNQLVQMRSELAKMGAFSERNLKVFDDFATEVNALHKLYAAVFQADRLVAPAEFWEQAEEAAKGPFEDGGEILARLQGGGDV